MKAILSHDVDHITANEHWLDGIILKHLVRSKLELFKGKISWQELMCRYQEIFSNKWNYVSEIISLHQSMGVKSTFFVGVNNGLGLSYSQELAQAMIQYIQNQDFEVGIHGINYDSYEGIQMEFDRFRSFSAQDRIGMRMHYLRKNEYTFQNLDKAGYAYDSTDTGFKNPYRIGNMWEFPVQVMDGWIMCGSNRYLSYSLKEVKRRTQNELDKAEKEGLAYLSIIFHDRYFNEGFKTWKYWYLFLLEELNRRNINIIDGITAFNEVNGEV